jgi:uncharacterized RDD family membrane protein YckC
MSELSITTTQNVNINFAAAHVGDRVLANILDNVIKAAYALILGYVVFDLLGLEEYMETMDQWESGTIYLVAYLPVIFYSLVFESVFEGQTPGKKVMKIKVIKIDGYQAGFGDYLMRWLLRIVDIVLGFGLIGLITMNANKKNQRFGDMAAGTAVISLKNNISIDHTILKEVHDNYVPVYPLVIKLSDNDMRIIKETYEASVKNADWEMIAKLHTKIENVTGIKSVSANSMSFVDTVLHDYNYYTQRM